MAELTYHERVLRLYEAVQRLKQVTDEFSGVLTGNPVEPEIDLNEEQEIQEQSAADIVAGIDIDSLTPETKQEAAEKFNDVRDAVDDAQNIVNDIDIDDLLANAMPDDSLQQ